MGSPDLRTNHLTCLSKESEQKGSLRQTVESLFLVFAIGTFCDLCSAASVTLSWKPLSRSKVLILFTLRLCAEGFDESIAARRNCCVATEVLTCLGMQDSVEVGKYAFGHLRDSISVPSD